MSETMTLEQMFEIFGKGCMDPKCDHAHDGEPMILSGQCHPGEPVIVLIRDRKIQFQCAECERAIITIDGGPKS
jgi:hypothetical protein